jgi:uncharacterized linocin/CFP29 family protein
MKNSGNHFQWSQDNLNQLIWKTSADARMMRPLLKLYGKQGLTTNIIGHQVNSGPPLTVSTTQNLSPTTLSCDFKLDQTQYSDEDALHSAVAEAAYRVAAAEDAVILLGKDAEDFLGALGVTATNLSLQVGLLPSSQTVEQGILDSIIQGITDLGTKAKNRRLRNYVAVVSLDLYAEAFRNQETPSDAPIYEIRPLLMQDGFQYSQALPPKTGLLFSASGDPIKIAVPMDATVEADPELSGSVTLRVTQQIRLVVDVPEAVVALK